MLFFLLSFSCLSVDVFLFAENGFVTIISQHKCLSCASDHSMDELREKQTVFEHFTNHNKPSTD